MKRASSYLIVAISICIGVFSVGVVGNPHTEKLDSSVSFDTSGFGIHAHSVTIQEVNLSDTCSLNDPFGIRFSAYDPDCAGDACNNKEQCRSWGCDKCVKPRFLDTLDDPETSGKVCTEYTI